ncbi:LLM class F420-dependent oxidoreductase [Streptosporangiaceae bacterium NEAU-GS5]|nr:LLM class F420-dependent oxidoreductase [Streptosporangiaceae bacterium NEAU-GS5]
MDLRIFTEPQQGATYDELLAVAQAAERLGFDAFFRSDHYMRIGPGDPGPGSTDAWTTLAGLARETSRIRLGTLVTPATFRHPGALAITVAQVDQMSGGRVELGLGTGWFDAEHAAFGIPFPSFGERFNMLEEQLEIVTGMWTADKPFSYSGRHYQVVDSPGLPKPVQRPHPPIIVGGGGPKRTPRLVARFADEYNVPFRSLEDTGAAYQRVRDVADRPIILSAAQTVCVGADEAELARRAEGVNRGMTMGQSVDDLRAGGLAGTPPEVLDKIGKFRELGAERIYLQVMDLSDLDHLELIAAEILPHV